MLFFDTSAWVEYFIGSQKGSKINSILESERGKIVTPIIVLIELSCKSYKENADFDVQQSFIKQNSIIMNLKEELVASIGKTYAEIRRKNKKISLSDAIIIAMASEQKARIITCDSDFRAADNVNIIS